MNLPLDLNPLDVVLAVVFVLLGIRGAMHGFLEEVTGLVGLVAGLGLAWRFSPALADLVQRWTQSAWSTIIAFILVVALTMLAVSLISRLLHRFLVFASANWLNHLAGGAVGVVKGLVLCAIIVHLLGFVFAKAPLMLESRLVPFVREATAVLMQFLPKEIQRYKPGREAPQS